MSANKVIKTVDWYIQIPSDENLNNRYTSSSFSIKHKNAVTEWKFVLLEKGKEKFA